MQWCTDFYYHYYYFVLNVTWSTENVQRKKKNMNFNYPTVMKCHSLPAALYLLLMSLASCEAGIPGVTWEAKQGLRTADRLCSHVNLLPFQNSLTRDSLMTTPLLLPVWHFALFFIPFICLSTLRLPVQWSFFFFCCQGLFFSTLCWCGSKREILFEVIL